jgi:hypothetical protein
MIEFQLTHCQPLKPTDLKIPHPLCLPGTRVHIISSILNWSQSKPTSTSPAPVQASASVTSEPESAGSHLPVLCVVGDQGTGKSAVLATVACEWKRSGSLLSATFLQPNQDSGRALGDEDAHPDQPTGNLGRTKSMIVRLTSRRNSPRRSKTLPFDTTRVTASLRDAAGAVKAVVIDGLDHISPSMAVKTVKETLELVKAHPNLRLLLSAKTTSSIWLKTFSGEKIHFLSVDKSSDGRLFHEQVTLATETAQDEHATGVNMGSENATKDDVSQSIKQDFATFVSSRLCLSLSPADQARIVEAADGSFATLAHLCREVEEAGANERVLDGVLYREKVRKHGEGIKVILV